MRYADCADHAFVCGVYLWCVCGGGGDGLLRYTAVRSVEALNTDEVSQLDQDTYVQEVARARATLRQERRAASTMGRTSFIDKLTRRAAKIPGAGEYVLPETDKSPVAKWGDQNPKSDVEWQIYRAKQLPGPGEPSTFQLIDHVYLHQSPVWLYYDCAGEYKNVQPPRHSSSVRFGTHNPKSEFEWIEYRAKQIPVGSLVALQLDWDLRRDDKHVCSGPRGLQCVQDERDTQAQGAAQRARIDCVYLNYQTQHQPQHHIHVFVFTRHKQLSLRDPNEYTH